MTPSLPQPHSHSDFQVLAPSVRRAFVLLGALYLCLSPGHALANGGGYAFGVKLTGSVAPFQASGTEQVRILEENLDIVLRRMGASVTVRYAMKNLADVPVRVRFGFPVEAMSQEDEDLIDPNQMLEREQRHEKLRRAVQQLRGYAVTADGAPVRSAFQIEPFATGKIAPFPGSEVLQDVGGWMVSEVTFPASATVRLEIRYAADYLGAVTYVSDDGRRSPSTFGYRLSTGAVWNGPIEKGTVSIRADGIPADEVEITAPRERFKRDGDRWTWAFEALEPTLADDIVIRAIPGSSDMARSDLDEPDRKASGVRWYLEREGKWGMGHKLFRAKASSTLKPNREHRFGPEHLAELHPKAPWAEGVPGDGVGEWVELVSEKPAPLLALGITPGFHAFEKPELFQANGRPSRVEILLNGERRFEATLGDRPERQLVPVLGYTKPVAKVRITIREVTPGSKWSDTCITDVVLYDRLDKKPEVRGNR